MSTLSIRDAVDCEREVRLDWNIIRLSCMQIAGQCSADQMPPSQWLMLIFWSANFNGQYLLCYLFCICLTDLREAKLS